MRFWGVRGSLPCPGPDTVIYGGNTSCLEIRADDRLVIIDLGTGVRPLGDWLIKNDLKKRGKIEADIFLTHTHWDHIMGFPMFNPIYIPGTQLRITAPVSLENESLKSIIENQMSHKYWPVRAQELAASIEYKQIRETVFNPRIPNVKEAPLDLGGGLTVTCKFLNHPIFCLGYRINYKGKSIATVYDHEPFQNLFPSASAGKKYDAAAALEGEGTAAEENERVRQFISGADIVVHDAQYTEEEYKGKAGWGHCSYKHAVQAAENNNIKKLVFFHHEPAYADKQLEQLEKNYMKNSGFEIMMAREGITLEA